MALDREIALSVMDDVGERRLMRITGVNLTVSVCISNEFGVLPSDELDDGEVETIAEFDPFEYGPAR